MAALHVYATPITGPDVHHLGGLNFIMCDVARLMADSRAAVVSRNAVSDSRGYSLAMLGVLDSVISSNTFDHNNHGLLADASSPPDDVLDVVGAPGLEWDPADETGIALHMVSGVAAAGNIGATGIADSATAAAHLLSWLRTALDDACGVGAKADNRVPTVELSPKGQPP